MQVSFKRKGKDHLPEHGHKHQQQHSCTGFTRENASSMLIPARLEDLLLALFRRVLVQGTTSVCLRPCNLRQLLLFMLKRWNVLSRDCATAEDETGSAHDVLGICESLGEGGGFVRGEPIRL